MDFLSNTDEAPAAAPRGGGGDELGDGLLAAMAAAPAHILLPKGYVSVSQLNLYLKCGRQYYLKYVQEEPRTSSSNMVHGQYVHSIVEWALKEKIAGRPTPTHADVMDHISASLHDKFSEVERWDTKIPDIETAEASTRKMMAFYIQDRLPTVRPRVVEYEIATLLRGEIPFTGYIDLVEKNAMEPEGYTHPTIPNDVPRLGDTLVDLKNTGKKYPDSRVASSLQLSLYSAATGVEEVGFDLLVDRKKNPGLIMQRSYRSREETEHALDLTEDIVRAISMGHFPRTQPDSWQCTNKWCHFWSQCRGTASRPESTIIA